MTEGTRDSLKGWCFPFALSSTASAPQHQTLGFLGGSLGCFNASRLDSLAWLNPPPRFADMAEEEGHGTYHRMQLKFGANPGDMRPSVGETTCVSVHKRLET